MQSTEFLQQPNSEASTVKLTLPSKVTESTSLEMYQLVLQCVSLGAMVLVIILFLDYLDYPLIMTTILVKTVSEELEKELRKLKASLGCRTWADLLAKLVASENTRSVSEERLSEMKMGVREFLQLRATVSNKWKGSPTVVEETRKSRKHDST